MANLLNTQSRLASGNPAPGLDSRHCLMLIQISVLISNIWFEMKILLSFLLRVFLHFNLFCQLEFRGIKTIFVTELLGMIMDHTLFHLFIVTFWLMLFKGLSIYFNTQKETIFPFKMIFILSICLSVWMLELLVHLF